MAALAISNIWTQYFPPAPRFTERDVPSQRGRVFVVTGGNAGVGYELCKMLYGTGATVYMASRSEEKAKAAIASITSATPAPASPGPLKFLQLDFEDLAKVKAAATTLAQQESRIDVIWHNAGIGGTSMPPNAKTAQNIEMFTGVHCVGPFLFTQLLLKQLQQAARESSPQQRPRVVWTASLLIEQWAPKGGLHMEKLEDGHGAGTENYAVSKVGSWALAKEFGKRYGGGDQGILSICQNPGNLYTGIYSPLPWIFIVLLNLTVLYPAKYGAYTELYAGLSPDVNQDTNGMYIMPWGRIREESKNGRKDVDDALRSEEDGGRGIPPKFWAWCEEKIKPFL